MLCRQAWSACSLKHLYSTEFALSVFQHRLSTSSLFLTRELLRPETMSWSIISLMSSTERTGILQGLENQDGGTEDQKLTRREEEEVGRWDRSHEEKEGREGKGVRRS